MKKRIGFKHYDEEPQIQTNTTPAINGSEVPQPTISQAHMGLMQKINGIANIILEPNFKELTKEQQASYVQTLMYKHLWKVLHLKQN